MRVGIIDDNFALLKQVSNNLNNYNEIQIVFECLNGKECLARLASQSDLPELLLMDIEMPEMDGIQTTQIITEKYPEIDVIMLTVFEDDDHIIEAIKAGAKSYLLKTESIEFIVNTMQEVKKGYSQLSPYIARKVLTLMQKNQSNHSDSTNNENKSSNELTKREYQILETLSKGLRYKEIAEQLYIETNTVKRHIRNIYGKLNVNTQVQAIQALKNMPRPKGKREY